MRIDDFESGNTDEMVAILAALRALTPAQRKIFLTYAAKGTYTAVAKEFKVSVPTARNYIKALQAKIKEMANVDRRFDID